MTHMFFRIRGAILDGLRKKIRCRETPGKKRKEREKLHFEKLEQKLLRTVTLAKEVADELGISEEEVNLIRNEHFFSSVLSINEKPREQDENDCPAYNIKDTKADLPEEKVIKDELIDELSQLISQLIQRAARVSLFYKEELTFTEIGKILNLSTSRISQIHSKCLAKLRQSLQKLL